MKNFHNIGWLGISSLLFVTSACPASWKERDGFNSPLCRALEEQINKAGDCESVALKNWSGFRALNWKGTGIPTAETVASLRVSVQVDDISQVSDLQMAASVALAKDEIAKGLVEFQIATARVFEYFDLYHSRSTPSGQQVFVRIVRKISSEQFQRCNNGAFDMNIGTYVVDPQTLLPDLRFDRAIRGQINANEIMQYQSNWVFVRDVGVTHITNTPASSGINSCWFVRD